VIESTAANPQLLADPVSTLRPGGSLGDVDRGGERRVGPRGCGGRHGVIVPKPGPIPQSGRTGAAG